MPNKYFILNSYTFTDKGVRRYLAMRPYVGVFLNFDERADLRIVSDTASVEVH
jgi:hypothetical protein